MRMPFGKWKGEPLEHVDRDYLQYALRSFKLGSTLRYAIECVLSGREIPAPPPKEDWMSPLYRRVLVMYRDIANKRKAAMSQPVSPIKVRVNIEEIGSDL
jgi:hypothetical protein